MSTEDAQGASSECGSVKSILLLARTAGAIPAYSLTERRDPLVFLEIPRKPSNHLPIAPGKPLFCCHLPCRNVCRVRIHDPWS